MQLTDLERNEIQNLLYGYDCEHIPQLKEATNKIFDYVQKLVGQIGPLVMPKIAEIEKLKELLVGVYKIAEEAPELNMGNYNEDEVFKLNNFMIDIFTYLSNNKSNFTA